ncbi:MAG: outer membrane beta-barrel protein [Muribaculaceae bacterium]|nr:outer membrane beta-barrel protein [Muribaculaceae bacterium]
MKKLIIAIVALTMGMAANAQAFVGGTLGVDVTHVSTEAGGSATQTVFQIAPEIGYNINKTWAVGAQVGYGLKSVEGESVNNVRIMPYVRATFASASIVDFFGELGAGYAYQSYEGNDASGFAMELRPGMAINLTPSFALIARTTLLGFEHWDHVNAVEFALNKSFELGVSVKF